VSARRERPTAPRTVKVQVDPVAQEFVPGIEPKPAAIPLPHADTRPYFMIEKSLGTGDLTKVARRGGANK